MADQTFAIDIPEGQNYIIPIINNFQETEVYVEWTYIPGSAQYGVDFNGSGPSDVVQVSQGSQLNIEVKALSDSVDEQNEGFTLRMVTYAVGVGPQSPFRGEVRTNFDYNFTILGSAAESGPSLENLPANIQFVALPGGEYQSDLYRLEEGGHWENLGSDTPEGSFGDEGNDRSSLLDLLGAGARDIFETAFEKATGRLGKVGDAIKNARDVGKTVVEYAGGALGVAEDLLSLRITPEEADRRLDQLKNNLDVATDNFVGDQFGVDPDLREAIRETIPRENYSLEEVNSFRVELNPNFAGATGSEQRDVLVGGIGNDALRPLGGDDTILGRDGLDTVYYRGALANYDIVAVSEGALRIIDRTGVDGADTLRLVERAQFSDQQVDLTQYAKFSVTADGVHRFFNTQTGGHFFTISDFERDQVVATIPYLRPEGTGFGGFATDQGAATEEVYRFFNTKTGGHFFTTSEYERDQVIATDQVYKLEGVGFYDFATDQGAATEEVYRFFNTKTGGHFFTASETERDQVIATDQVYRFEGIAFYAPQDGATLVI